MSSAQHTNANGLIEFYQEYSPEEDQDRTNVHYEMPVEFFYAVTGGKWNVYSCNLWDVAGANDPTSSQEAKLDRFAHLMNLQPGQRILDVGCGWGGPLTYLCQKYGVEGVGLTLSPKQKAAADERIARAGVKAEVQVRHWEQYTDDRPFDAVYTDEVIVHFFHLGDFFKKAYSLLRDGGVMLNKELHYVHPRYSEMNRAISHINEIYGFTGNYRPLAEELRLANEAGFDVKAVEQIPLSQYKKTAGNWLDNMDEHKDELISLVGEEYYKRFKVYLRIIMRTFAAETMTLDMILSQKPVSQSKA